MTCNATIGQKPGRFGFEPIQCRQTVGIRTYVTTGGVRVGYCPIGGHEQNVRRRFAELQDPPEPVWFHEQQAHESHDESFDYGCRLCQAEFDEAYRTYDPGQTYSRAELEEIVADRQLVRDEHLDAMAWPR